MFQIALCLEAQSRAIQENEEAGVGHDGTNLRTFSGETFDDEVNVALHIVEHLLLPLPTFVAVTSHHTIARKDIAKVLIRAPNVVEVLLAKLLVVHNRLTCHDAGHVEGLCGSLQGNADAACFLADAGKRNVLVSTEDHVAMYLVAHHDDALFCTNVCNLLQIFLRPTYSGRIVRVAKNHHLAAFDVATKRLEVHCERGFRATKRALYHHSLACLGHKAEGMIDGLLNEDAVALLCEGLHGEEDTRHHPGNVANHLARDVHSMLFLVPTTNAFVVRRVLTSVAQDALFQAFTYGIEDERRCSEVHISHPHRQQVIGAALVLHTVNLYRISSLARNYLVEVVFLHHS